MLLFIRTQKGLRLTPAGTVLYDEMFRVMQDYKKGISRAQQVSMGYTGQLKIGIISGMRCGTKMKQIMTHFEKNFPNVKMELHSYSFQDLLKKLYQKELDVVISYDFHIDHKADIITRKFISYHPAWIVPYSNPLSKRDVLNYSDMKDQEILMVQESECPEGFPHTVEMFKKNGDFYPKFYFVDTMERLLLWLEVSNKCALLNEESVPDGMKDVKVFPILGPHDFSEIKVGWMNANDNFALRILIDYLKEYE